MPKAIASKAIFSRQLFLTHQLSSSRFLVAKTTSLRWQMMDVSWPWEIQIMESWAIRCTWRSRSLKKRQEISSHRALVTNPGWTLLTFKMWSKWAVDSGIPPASLRMVLSTLGVRVKMDNLATVILKIWSSQQGLTFQSRLSKLNAGLTSPWSRMILERFTLSEIIVTANSESQGLITSCWNTQLEFSSS